MQIAETFKYLDAVRKQSRWTHSAPRHWQKIQSNRLKQLLKYATQNSPFYAEKMHGIHWDQRPLAELPWTTKEELRERVDDQWTDRSLSLQKVREFLADSQNANAWFENRYCIYQTSGTHGASLPILQSREELRTVSALMASRSGINRRPSISEGIRRWLAPKRVAVVTLRDGFFPSRTALSLLPSLAGQVVDLKHFSSMQSDLLEALQAFAPHTIFSYASVLDFLARDAARCEWTSLESLSNSSEQLTTKIQERVQNAFRVPVTNHYGTGECLQLADTCSHGSMHVNADWAILEPVDHQRQPVAPGEVSDKVLVTNLANYVQPFIRYEIDDRIQLVDGRECGCGCSFPMIVSFQGRSSEQIYVANEAGKSILLPGVLFHSVFDRFPQCLEWRIVQRSQNSLTIEVELHSRDKENLGAQVSLFQSISNELHGQGVPGNVSIEVHSVEKLIGDLNSGKFRRFLPCR